MCMTFDLPGDDVYHLVATEAYIDNAQVMHHILLHSCEDARELPTIDTPTSCDMGNPLCSSIISIWTVGYAGHCLPPQAGYRFGRGFFTRVVMEVHWNNPELHSDYMDSSGLTVYYTRQLRPNNAPTLMVGQTGMTIPPQQPSVTITADMPGTCTRQLMTRPFYVFSAINHMHYMGKSQKLELFRNEQLVNSITNEEVYSYDNPIMVHHDPAVEFRPGDELRTTCVYNSMYRNTTVHFGLATSDEMCFCFLMVYPVEAVPYLKRFINDGQSSVCDWTDIPQHHDNETTPTGNPPTHRPRPTSGSGSDTSGRTTPAAGWLEGCNTYEFADTNRPTFRLLLGRLAQSCSAFGSCHHECRALMDEMADEPCLHGNAWRAVVGQLSRSHEGLMMVAYINSCPVCPRCQSCGPV